MDSIQFDEKVQELVDEEVIARQLDKKKGEAEDLLKDKDKMEQFLKRLEHKLGVVPVAGQYLSDIPILISLVRAYINKSYTQIPIGSIIAIVCALIYFLSPVDVIPDVIPALGYLDDAAVLGIAYKLVHDDIREYKEWREKSSRRWCDKGEEMN